MSGRRPAPLFLLAKDGAEIPPLGTSRPLALWGLRVAPLNSCTFTSSRGGLVEPGYRWSPPPLIFLLIPHLYFTHFSTSLFTLILLLEASGPGVKMCFRLPNL